LLHLAVKTAEQRTGQLAKYQNIIDWINKEIDNGNLLPGEKIPSENELCERFGLSRQTVRHAIGKMSEDGLLESRRGSGTYFAD
jgi:GntR family transcriptional regulator of arabinose operon